jgi:heme/copper-type cytochrome/quinol oxidase subunit 3
MSAITTARPRRAAPNGIWGMALFLCAEVALFGTMIGSYFYLDFESHHWPQAHIKPESIPLPAIATVWLLVTLIPIGVGSRRAQLGERLWAARLIAVGFLLQAGYLAFQIILYIDDFHRFRPQSSAYASIYYTLLTTHHAHVAFGLLLDLVIAWKIATKGLTDYWLIAVRGLALYWYVVGAVAVFVTLTLLAPSL